MRISSAPSWAWFLLFGLLFCAQVIPNLFNNSPINDEPIELTNGYFYWSGDVTTHDYHPPLAKVLEALPLRAMNLNRAIPPSMRENQLRAYSFFFQLNRGLFEWMTLLGRSVCLLFGLGIGLLLFWKTREGPPIVLTAAMVLWAFEPTLLAYSGLALADIPVTFFFFAAVLAFQSQLEKPASWKSFAAGALAGAAVCCKFSALVLVPVFILLQLFQWFQQGKRALPANPQSDLKGWITGAIGFLACVGLVYLPGTLKEPQHLMPWSYFWNGLMDMAHYADYHHPTFFLGQASRENHWFYFPAAFALKCTLPFVFLTLLSLAGGLGKRHGLPPWVWVPPLLLVISIIPVQNLGIRYLLPAFPFLVLMISKFIGAWWDWKTPGGRSTLKIAFAGLLIWHAASTLASAPHMISYFNDLVPWEKKIYCLGDSNLDIGQDLKRLGDTARQRGWGRVKLAQFGGAVDPSVYGMAWDYWTQKDLSGPQPGHVYAVNVFLLQLGPVFSPSMAPIAKSWVATTPISGRVGDTWIYFEVPGKPITDSSPPIPSVSVF